MPRADGKGGVFDIREGSAYSDQAVIGNIVPNGTGEADSLTVIDGREIETSTQEFVDESAVVIASHTNPSLIANLTVEDVY